MDYMTSGVLFADRGTPGEAWVSVRYGFAGEARAVVFLDHARHGDAEAEVTLTEARALTEAVRSATQRALESRPPRRKGMAVIACTDPDTLGRGRIVVREGEGAVAISMTIPDHYMIPVEVAMGQEEAAALIGILEAALRWMAEYRPQG